MITLTKQQEADAQTLANYITLESLESELTDMEEVMADGDGYEGLENCIAVVKRACIILGGDDDEA